MDTSNAARPAPPTTTTTVATATQGAAIAPGGAVAGRWSGWIACQAVGGDINLLFGTADVAAATTSDWTIAEGTVQSFFVGRGTNYVSVAGAGSLQWYAS